MLCDGTKASRCPGSRRSTYSTTPAANPPPRDFVFLHLPRPCHRARQPHVSSTSHWHPVFPSWQLHVHVASGYATPAKGCSAVLSWNGCYPMIDLSPHVHADPSNDPLAAAFTSIRISHQGSPAPGRLSAARVRGGYLCSCLHQHSHHMQRPPAASNAKSRSLQSSSWSMSAAHTNSGKNGQAAQTWIRMHCKRQRSSDIWIFVFAHGSSQPHHSAQAPKTGKIVAVPHNTPKLAQPPPQLPASQRDLHHVFYTHSLLSCFRTNETTAASPIAMPPASVMLRAWA